MDYAEHRYIVEAAETRAFCFFMYLTACRSSVELPALRFMDAAARQIAGSSAG